MSEPIEALILGPTGTPATSANPLPIGIANNAAAVNINNPLPVIPGALVANVNASGTATSPAAGSAFVTTPALAAGWYQVEVAWTITGTAETKPLNVRLLMTTGGSITDLPSSPGIYPGFTVNAVLVSNANDTIKLVATTIATTGAIYTGTLTLYRLA